jgi:hypothetical protein
LPVVLLPAALGILLAEILSLGRIPSAEVRVTCDQAVQTPLPTRDPVEWQRADLLIQHLNCSVSCRLPHSR